MVCFGLASNGGLLEFYFWGVNPTYVGTNKLRSSKDKTEFIESKVYIIWRSWAHIFVCVPTGVEISDVCPKENAVSFFLH